MIGGQTVGRRRRARRWIALCAAICLLHCCEVCRGAPSGDAKPLAGKSQADLKAGSKSDAKDASAANNKTKSDKKKSPADLAKEKPKPDFSRLLFRLRMSDRRDALHTIKPGHWTAVTIETCANHFDFEGALTLGACQSDRSPLDIEGAPFYLTIDRAAILPKAQKKLFEAPFFTPRGVAVDGFIKRPWVDCHLNDAGTQISVKQELDELQTMPHYQFQFLVLARLPERFTYLQTLPSVRPPGDEAIGRSDPYLYRMIAPPVGARASLPRNPLMLTSLAYIIWDEIHPDVLDEEQRQAVLDWLHWGGHLIVSGPATLELLQKSFLAPYLPATRAEDISLPPDRLAALDARWSSLQVAKDRKALAGGGDWPAARLKLLPGGVFLSHTDELVAERPVGRGRIVATAFSLSQPGITKWRGFDGLLSSCLLRHDPRKFAVVEEQVFVSPVTWLNDRHDRNDKNVVLPYAAGERLTHLRFFARDAVAEPQPDAAADEELNRRAYQQMNRQYDPLDSDELGVASWNDVARVPTTARQSLRQGAGIKVPSPNFVLWVVGLYLIVLVPVNWSLFRLLGRVEWAWGASPLIAAGCAALVIWLAQLDIGFNRSSTELAILEIEGDYPRAHLTRYTALYASLSTSYNLTYDDPSAVALPFGRADHKLLSGESHRQVRFHGQGQPQLTGLDVTSNSTSMVHSESFYNLGGSITWNTPDSGPAELVNATPLSLVGVSLVRRWPQAGAGSGADAIRAGGIEVAWIGNLRAGQSVEPTFEPGESAGEFADPWGGDRKLVGPSEETSIDLSKLVALAEAKQNIEPGELRLVGWHLEDLPGVNIEPAAVRRRHATLVVAHLARHNDVDIQPDRWETSAENLLDARPPLDVGALPILNPDAPAEMPTEDAD